MAFVVIALAIGYKLYEQDLYVWSCDSEANTGSCLLASRIYFDNENKIMGEKYLRKSCSGNYALGCFELGNFLRDEATLKKACELGHKPACKKN